jgi:hypothetical protein
MKITQCKTQSKIAAVRSGEDEFISGEFEAVHLSEMPF